MCSAYDPIIWGRSAGAAKTALPSRPEEGSSAVSGGNDRSKFAEELVMIHYDIDTTENGYKKFEGNIELLIELKHILFKNDVVPDLVGYLSFDDIPNVSICISAQKELGFFVSITDGKNIYLTLGDRNTLNETVDIWGDGLYISKGLFIPFSLAWKGLEEYLIYHKLSNKINWITSDEVPEEGNIIC